MTRNITLAVDDEILARYRAVAAAQKTSVNALIRKHMADAVGARTDAQKEAIVRMIERSETGPRATFAPTFDRASLWNRGERG